ncbi:MAG TPA: Si-specific NAD(P)(+) transhydrogenase [Gemmatimonadaceae bacterium]|nr:Si-specific NAD(P)(+) transhydrogenase [Gemmatimonadaceae bacterium]
MHYDLVVIGAGPAGEKGAAQAAYFGKRVCIVERAPKPGGAAVNTGTVPSKALRETALYFSGLRQRGLYGVDYHVKRDITIGDFMFRERSVIEAEWKLIDDNIKRHEIEQVQGAATFVDRSTIAVARYGTEPRHISGDVFLIATGSQPQQPENVAVDGTVIVDSDTLLTLEKIPASMIVVGGGVVGCEYACIFAALGVRVTIVTSRPRLLAHLDAEVSEAFRQQITGRLGVAVYVDTEVDTLAVENERAVVTLGGGMELTADCALYSAGRVGASTGLGLEAIGVATNSRGFILVDEHYRTAVPRIYAAGDVIGFPALASTSMEQARVAVCHAFDLKYKQAVADVIPYGVYTIPEIATVGMTEEQLRVKGIDYEIGRSWYRTNARGQIIGDLEGFVKLLFSPTDQRLLGASIVGENASELIHIAMACLTFGGTIDFFIQSVFNYPSLAEAYKYAAYDGLQAMARRMAKKAGLPASGTYRAVAADGAS